MVAQSVIQDFQKAIGRSFFPHTVLTHQVVYPSQTQHIVPHKSYMFCESHRQNITHVWFNKNTAIHGVWMHTSHHQEDCDIQRSELKRQHGASQHLLRKSQKPHRLSHHAKIETSMLCALTLTSQTNNHWCCIQFLAAGAICLSETLSYQLRKVTMSWLMQSCECCCSIQCRVTSHLHPDKLGRSYATASAVWEVRIPSYDTMYCSSDSSYDR